MANCIARIVAASVGSLFHFSHPTPAARPRAERHLISPVSPPRTINRSMGDTRAGLGASKAVSLSIKCVRREVAHIRASRFELIKMVQTFLRTEREASH